MKAFKGLCLLVLIILCSCNGRENTKSDLKEPSVPIEKQPVKSSEKTPEDLVGLWKFTYPYSGDLIEDHYMRIEQQGTVLSGTYYGTTDDFDRAREGYLPGFFRADMQDIKFKNDTLSFGLKIQKDELYQVPIPLTLSKSIAYEGEKWQYGITFEKREYQGVYRDGKVTLFTKFDPREFVRLD